jgi:hypothetical protein
MLQLKLYTRALLILGPVVLTAPLHATTFTFEKIADTNTPIPGGQGNFTEFPIDFAYSFDAGQVAFIGRGASGQEGVYTGVAGQLTLVADKNTAMPGGPGNFSEFFGPSIDNGRVAFVAHYRNMAGQLRYEGVYTDLGGTLAPIADSNTLVPNSFGTFGVKFQHDPSLRAGQVVFTAANTFDEYGIYRSGPDGLVAIADSQTSVPGGTGNFTGVGIPSQSRDATEVVFSGSSFDSIPYQRGIYLAGEAGITRVADNRTPIPGGSGNFTVLDSPSVEDGQVVFRGSGANPTQQGIYLSDGVSLTRLVGNGDPVPDGTGTFTQGGFVGVSLDSGKVAFFGENSSIIPYERGIYTNLGGLWEKVIDLTDSLDGRTLGYFGRFSQSGLSGNQIAFMASFADGSRGLFVATADLPLPGDANGDGVVDNADLAIVVANYGTTSGATVTQGDLDGNGRVNLRDVLVVKSHFGETLSAAPPAAAIPEPATWISALVALIAICIGMRRNTKSNGGRWYCGAF